MNIAKQEIDLHGSDYNRNVVTIMPYSIEKKDENLYSSTVLSFWKYARKDVNIELFSEPQSLVEQRSSEWFGPTVLFTSSMLAGNNELVSIYCNIVSNYLYDFFKGNSENPSIKLKVLYKETKSSRTTEISYEGDISGIKELEKSIVEIVKKGF
jgi:hypothetical protein